MSFKYLIPVFFLISAVFFNQVVNAKIYCDKGTKRYHAEGCKEIKKIQKRNYSVFRTEPEAEARGYYPCQKCLPPVAKDHELSKVKRRHSLAINKTQHFIGDANTRLCHQTWCVEVGKIKPIKRVVFKDIDNAWKRNYKPCKICNPPVKPEKITIKEESAKDEGGEELLAPEME